MGQFDLSQKVTSSQNSSPNLNTVSTKLCTWKEQSQALEAGASSSQRKPNHQHGIRAVPFHGQWGLTLVSLQSLKHFLWCHGVSDREFNHGAAGWLFLAARFVILHKILIEVPGHPRLWSGSDWSATKRKFHRKGKGGTNLQRIWISHQH